MGGNKNKLENIFNILVTFTPHGWKTTNWQHIYYYKKDKILTYKMSINW